mgnify:CR=1 FL=1
MILSYESGRLTEKKSYREALRLESSVSPILSITGAGGKTTTALHLAYEYKEVGNPAVVTTSTHLAIWDQPWFLLEESTEKLQQIRRQYGQDPDDKTEEKGRVRSEPADTENESRFRSIF